jgi:hypothetical protein
MMVGVVIWPKSCGMGDRTVMKGGLASVRGEEGDVGEEYGDRRSDGGLVMPTRSMASMDAASCRFSEASLLVVGSCMK